MKTLLLFTLAIALFVGCKKADEEKSNEINLEGTVWVLNDVTSTFTKDTLYSLDKEGYGSVLHYVFQKPNGGTYGGAAVIDKDSVRKNVDTIRYFDVKWTVSNDSLYSFLPINSGTYAWGKRK